MRQDYNKELSWGKQFHFEMFNIKFDPRKTCLHESQHWIFGWTTTKCVDSLDEYAGNIDI